MSFEQPPPRPPFVGIPTPPNISGLDRNIDDRPWWMRLLRVEESPLFVWRLRFWRWAHAKAEAFWHYLYEEHLLPLERQQWEMQEGAETARIYSSEQWVGDDVVAFWKEPAPVFGEDPIEKARAQFLGEIARL